MNTSLQPPTVQHSSPKLHNAMWPGLVGKGPGSEPYIDLDTMLDLTASAAVDGVRFDGVDLFLYEPHVDIDSTDDDLRRLAEKVSGKGLLVGSVVAPVWPNSGGGSAMDAAVAAAMPEIDEHAVVSSASDAASVEAAAVAPAVLAALDAPLPVPVPPAKAAEVPAEVLEDLNNKDAKGKALVKGKKFASDHTFEEALKTLKGDARIDAGLVLAMARHRLGRVDEARARHRGPAGSAPRVAVAPRHQTRPLRCCRRAAPRTAPSRSSRA